VRSLYNEHVLSSLDTLEEIQRLTEERCTLAEADMEPLQGPGIGKDCCELGMHSCLASSSRPVSGSQIGW